MTIDEAINILEEVKELDDSIYQYNTKYLKALDMAIQALEQEPSGDAVSRQAVLALFDKSFFRNWELGLLERKIKDLPPVKPSYTDAEIDKMQELEQAQIEKAYQLGQEDRPTGHWISHREYCEINNLIPSGLGSYFWCSECDCGIDVKEWHRNNYNYCPNCDAKMQEVEK